VLLLLLLLLLKSKAEHCVIRIYQLAAITRSSGDNPECIANGKAWGQATRDNLQVVRLDKQGLGMASMDYAKLMRVVGGGGRY
jgi:hypothetical protein